MTDNDCDVNRLSERRTFHCSCLLGLLLCFLPFFICLIIKIYLFIYFVCRL